LWRRKVKGEERRGVLGSMIQENGQLRERLVRGGRDGAGEGI
jgi:hypothetical protein